MTATTMHLRLLSLLLLALLWACCLPALAHKPSDSYLTLSAHDDGHIDVEWHIALRDLDNERQLDADEDGRLTWGEVRSRWPELLGYVQPHLILTRQDGTCVIVPDSTLPPALARHTDGRYAVMRWRQQCPTSSDTSIGIDYKLFSLTDPTHRGIVHLRSIASHTGDVEERGIVVMGGDRPEYRLTMRDAPAMADGITVATSSASASSSDEVNNSQADIPMEQGATWQTLWHFVHEGMLHIASGIDHVLFLVSLLLVAVWQRSPDATWRKPMHGWTPRSGWRDTLKEVVRLVTAFTLAHSITLGLAAYGVLSPPSRWVESLIAATVLLAVLDNLFPITHAPRWLVVFVFGLVHGFGFAGALQDLGLDGENLAWPLLGFNLGVEAGQLLVVAAMLPVAYLMRGSRTYRYGVVLPASVAIAILAGIWLVERAGDIVILGWAV